MELLISLVIGTIGFAYFIYGKNTTEYVYIVVGLILMIYPYFIQNLTYTIVLGIIFCISPFIIKNFL
jgi:hypothetical protein